jgi:hypothetical protein
VVGKDPVELEKYLEKKFALPEEDISTLITITTANCCAPVTYSVNIKFGTKFIIA